jgi:CCR4-NOT transcription complex subunit 1
MSSQQPPWGPPRHLQTTRLTPISTNISHEQRNTPSPSGSRPGFSPATSSFPSLPSSSARHVGSRKSSAASSTSAPFSPAHAGQQPPVGQLLSSRSRTITSQQPSQLASAAAAGSASSSGGGASVSRLVRASPSQSTSSTVGSPSTSANPSSASAHNQNLSRIVIAQVFLLLSQFGPVKDDKDRTKWETQAEQIRKVRVMHSFPRYPC